MPTYHRRPKSKVGTWNRQVEDATYGAKSERLQAEDVKRAKQGKGNSAASRLYHDNPISYASNKKDNKKIMQAVKKGEARLGGMPYTAVEKSAKKAKAKRQLSSETERRLQTATNKRKKAPTKGSQKAEYAKALYNASKRLNDSEKQKLYKRLKKK